jgi:hypothetical protein
LATKFESLSEDLAAATASSGEVERSVADHPGLSNAIDRFGEKWAADARTISANLQELAGLLRDSADSYQRAEDTVMRSAGPDLAGPGTPWADPAAVPGLGTVLGPSPGGSQ